MGKGRARHGGTAKAGPTAPAASRASRTRAPSQSFARIAILSALLLLALYTAFGLKRIEDQSRAQPLATAGDDVLGHLANQDDLRMQAGADDGIDRLHVVCDEGVDSRLFHVDSVPLRTVAPQEKARC